LHANAEALSRLQLINQVGHMLVVGRLHFVHCLIACGLKEGSRLGCVWNCMQTQRPSARLQLIYQVGHIHMFCGARGLRRSPWGWGVVLAGLCWRCLELLQPLAGCS
jgi:hypothetical protein